MLQKELFNLNKECIKVLRMVYKEKKVSLKKMESNRIPMRLLYALVRKKFLRFEEQEYSITIHGFDAIGLSVLKEKGLVKVGDRIGTGKEADIFLGKVKIKTDFPVNIVNEKYDLNGNINSFYKCINNEDKEIINNELLGEIKEMKNSETIDFNLLCSEKEREIDELIFYVESEEEENLEIKLGGYVRNSIDAGMVNKRDLEFTSLTIDEIENNRETLFFRSKNERVVDCVVKFHRLGRTSFRNVKNTRDYKSDGDWFTLSCRSAELEATNLEDFSKFPVPNLFFYSHHLVVMEYLEDYVLMKDVLIVNKDKIYNAICDFIINLYNLGFIHGDLNEFNILINEKEEIKVIDFPQTIKKESPFAKEYLMRDYKCINDFFLRKYNYIIKCEEIEQIIENIK